MAFTIKKAVTAFNGKIDDVAIVQLYLADWGYFKRPISGYIDQHFRLAMQKFILEQVDPDGQKSRSMKKVGFAVGSSELAELTLGFRDARLNNAEIIPGTNQIYVNAKPGEKSESGRDYLIPESLYAPLERALGNLPFPFAYQDVTLQRVWANRDTGSADKFILKVKFPKTLFVDAETAKLSNILPKYIRAYIRKTLSGTPWEIQPMTGISSTIPLITRKRTGLYKTMKRLSPYVGVNRVFEYRGNGFGGYQIPKKQDILKVVGSIHAARCARTGADGGDAIPEESAESKKIVNEILKIAPAGFKTTIESHCASCAELGSELKELQLADNILVSAIGARAEDFNKFKNEETILKEFEEVKNGFVKNTLDSLGNLVPFNPFETGALLTDPKLKTRETITAEAGFCEFLVGKKRIGDLFPDTKLNDNFISDKSFLSQGASDVAEFILEKTSGKGVFGQNTVDQIKRASGGAKGLAKILEIEDVLNALLSGCELVAHAPEYVADLDRIETAYQELTLALYNIWAKLEENEIRRVALLKDWNARDCDPVWWGWNQFIEAEAEENYKSFLSSRGVKVE